jgi:hypothetical protein
MRQTHADVETARRITQRERAQADRVRRGTISLGLDKACDVCRAPLVGASDELLYYPACNHGMHLHCNSASGNDGVRAARDNAAPLGTLRDNCPLCTRSGLLDFLTTPIELPRSHPAHFFES